MTQPSAQTEQAGDCGEKVWEKNNEITHCQVIVTDLLSITSRGHRWNSIENRNSHSTR